MSSPRVAIVIVNWNGYNDTVVCVESLKTLDYENYSVIVVDNASSDESGKALRERYPEHTILQSGSNLGFGGGSNIGIRHALDNGADYILLLNSDTKVRPDLLTNLLRRSESSGRIGLTGGRIEYMSPQRKVWAYGGAFNVNTGEARHIQNEEDLQSFVPNEPWFLYIPACLLLIRRKCLEEIGIFSEKYFHLVEDVEFCVRAQRKGWELALDPDAVLFHKGSASLPRFSPLYNYYEQRNRLFVIRQYRIERESVCLRLQDIFMILTRLFFTLMAVDKFSHFPRGARSLVFAVFDFFCDRGGKREDDLRYHTVPSLSERRPRRWKGDL